MDVENLEILGFSKTNITFYETTLTITGAKIDGTEFRREVPEQEIALNLGNHQLTSIILSDGLVNLEELNLYRNQLTSLTIPGNWTNLKELHLWNNQLTSLTILEGLENLKELGFGANQLTNLILPDGLTNLENLTLWDNQLASLTIPEGLENLKWLELSYNQLTELTLPKGLKNLEWLNLMGNQLSELTLPIDLASSVMPKRYNQPTLYLHNNPIKRLFVPRLMNIGKLSIDGFSQEDITFYGEGKPFIITGMNIDDTGFRREVSMYSNRLSFRGNQLSSLTIPPGLVNLRELNLGNNPIERLFIPHGMELENLEIRDFPKEEITRYTSSELSVQVDDNGMIVVLFSGGALQVADTISGNWKDLPSIGSSFHINPKEASQQFFRVYSLPRSPTQEPITP